MDILNYVNAGRYEPTAPYPSRDTPKNKAREMRIAYKTEQQYRLEEFKADLEKECGTKDHPKKDDLYRISWDYGHSSGLHDVAIYYDEMSTLLVDRSW